MDVMTREEIEQKMDELARQFAATHDPEIREEIYRLARQLEEMEKLEKQWGSGFRRLICGAGIIEAEVVQQELALV
jgi:hypothetical protein